MTKLKRLKQLKWPKWVLLGYFTSYLLLSLLGNYEGPYPSGNTRIFGGMWSVSDQYVWQPKGATFGPYDLNILGGVFSPLILIDRCIWHRDRQVDESILPQKE